MKSSSNILYYSINTKLAFYINENFYNRHFVWCSPVFNADKLDYRNIFRSIPPSSNPYTIFQRFKQDVVNHDMHSTYITQNKSGLKKGAIQMLSSGVVDMNDFTRINTIIDTASIEEFTPFIYLIPRNLIETKIKIVDVDSSANPLSIEYQIEDLRLSEFEIIDL